VSAQPMNACPFSGPQADPPAYVAVTKGAADGLLGRAAGVWVDVRAEPIDDACERGS
jgi:hypothetical protein